MSRYINISKSHEIIKTIKQLKTSSKPKHLYLIEDLSILELCMENKNNIDTFIFCDELEYSEQANKVIEYFLTKAKNAYSISKKTFQSIESKDNNIGLIALVEKQKRTQILKSNAIPWRCTFASTTSSPIFPSVSLLSTPHHCRLP